MAKTLNQINMDFRAANTTVARICDLAERLSKISDGRYTSVLNDINTNWTGDSANVFRQKGEQVKTKMSKTAMELHNAADTIQRMAKNTYDAEMNAYRLAQIRTVK